jgi:serine/threonine protein kinase
MAPEQMRGEAVDARTDVWALGVLLFELVTGRKPWQDASWPAVCARVLNEAAPPLAIRRRHAGGPGGSLAPLPESRAEDRYANVAELAVALSPLGGRSARVSLERIVRLATSTAAWPQKRSRRCHPARATRRRARRRARCATSASTPRAGRRTG